MHQKKTHARHAQTDLVVGHRVVSIKSFAGCGDPDAAPKSPKRFAFNNFDCLIFTSLYRIAPHIVNALAIVEPETVIRWHRAGFRLFWRWKSSRRGGRPLP